MLGAEYRTIESESDRVTACFVAVPGWIGGVGIPAGTSKQANIYT
jgi:hypothetical protein